MGHDPSRHLSRLRTLPQQHKSHAFGRSRWAKFQKHYKGLMLLEAAKRLKQVQVNRGRVTGQTRGD